MNNKTNPDQINPSTHRKRDLERQLGKKETVG